MKKMSVKLLSIVICLVLVISIAAPVALCSYSDYFPNWCDTPVVYVHGQGGKLSRTEADGSKTIIYNIEIPDGYIESFLTADNLAMFLKCYFTNNYNDFVDMLESAYVPLFKDVKLGKDGKPTDNSTAYYQNTRFDKNHTSDGKYDLNWWRVEYDWRLDPCIIADEVHKYVLKICEVTGKDNVALLGRCLGASVVTAYLDKYGYDHISDVVLYTSALDGATPMSRAFAGNAYFDENGLERFIYDLDMSDFISDEIIVQFIRAFLTAYNKIGGVKWGLNEVNRIYRIIAPDITPRLLRESYGTFPSYWAMVEDTDYEKAKSLMFGGQEVQWAEFIKKIDNYHYNIMMKSDEILQAAADAGVNVYNIEKYGMQEIPVTEDAAVISDRMVELSKCTKGAVTVPVGSSFSNEYIAKAFDAGNAKYISPDRQVDASTCLFRDTTWIIKNLDHMDFFDCVDKLICKVLDSHGKMTVFTDPDYPQYMVFDYETKTIAPMTTENCNTTDRWNVSFLQALKFMIENFKYVFDYILSFLGI